MSTASMPGPLANWRASAACKLADAALFFATSGETGPAREHREAAAKAICARCPSRLPCLEFGVAQPSDHGTYGIFGGLTEAELQSERRRRSALSRRRAA